MSKEILEKAIQKAIDCGWDYKQSLGYADNIQFNVAVGAGRIKQVSHLEHLSKLKPTDFIFNHDFAKALWGEELHHDIFIVPEELNKRFAGTKDLDVKPVWQYHLQQMVIAEDPIKYLGEHL